MMWARPALVLERFLILLFLGYSSCSFAVFHLHLCRDNVGANEWEWVDFATILVERFFSSFPHWATYKNRLDAVLGVDRVVFRNKPVTKLTSPSCWRRSCSLFFANVLYTKNWLPVQEDSGMLCSHI